MEGGAEIGVEGAEANDDAEDEDLIGGEFEVGEAELGFIAEQDAEVSSEEDAVLEEVNEFLAGGEDPFANGTFDEGNEDCRFDGGAPVGVGPGDDHDACERA